MPLFIDGKIDPLAILDEGRQLSTCPHHFIRIKIDQMFNTQQARPWIWENLTGRFSIQPNFVAFENYADASMFALVCDQFKINDNF